MRDPFETLAGVDAFRDLSQSELQQLASRSSLVQIQRGRHLIRQGEDADALYIVVSGRFTVYRDGQIEPIAEIGAGLPIGEIAFFTGGTRTASIVAERDSLVLRLEKEEFESLARTLPDIWRTVTATLARRLAETTSGRNALRIAPRPRTICILPTGGSPIPPGFLHHLQGVFGRHLKALFLDAASGETQTGSALDDTRWFNDLENRYDAVIFIAGDTLSDWSQKAIRQADLVLCVGQQDNSTDTHRRAVSPLEQFAADLHKSERMRLVILHERGGPFHGTRNWLDARPWCHMHHHVILEHDADYERLYRFLSGRALGLVACGGGAFSTAHIGIFQAFQEAGLVFDMMGGTSGGAAMTAALAMGADCDEIERRAHDIFVTRKALRRWTLPRYSLLDPAVFDDAFSEHFTSIDISDLPIPYFSISTNLSRNKVHCHRLGPLWQAVRASCTIPALLPPAYTEDGDMLVDGCLLENLPIHSMHQLKSGPNIAIDFRVPVIDHSGAAGRALPSRRQLIMSSLTPRMRRELPSAPSPQAVLLRSLLLHSQGDRAELGPDDVLLELHLPENITHLDWHKHAELRRHGYDFAQREIDRIGIGRLGIVGLERGAGTNPERSAHDP